MKVEQAMTQKAVTVSPDDSVAFAYTLMRRGSFRHLPVVDGRELVGMVSDRDLLKLGSVDDEGVITGHRKIREAMTKGVFTCTRGEKLGDAIDRMLHHGFDALVVVNDASEVLGILTSTDLLAELRRLDGVTDMGAVLEGKTRFS